MQSPSSILDFPHSPPNIPSKHFETFMKQQKVDKSNNNIPIPTNYPISPESKAGVTTSFFHKLTEIAAYTSATISEAYNTLTVGGVTEPVSSTRKRRDYDSGYFGDVMQINADDSDGAYDNDEMSDVEMECNSQEINKKIDKKIDRKNEAKWAVNDEEEPPPPYDNSWSMPTTSTGANNLTDASMSSSPKRISFATSQVEDKPTSDTRSATMPQTIPKRRQIRVRRPRRLLRRKSTSTEVSTPRGGGGRYDDPDKLLLKVNDKLSDMIAQGRAALKSKVDITEVEMLLAEEREREERIMKELGLQTPVGRKGRKNTSYQLDCEYFNSISDGNYSSPESSYCEYGFGAHNGHGSGFASPTEFETPDAYHYNTPSQFGSSGVYHQTQGGFNYSNLGFSINNNNNGGKFGEPLPNEFMSPIPNRYHGPSSSSSGFGEHATSKGFGTGPISGGFGGPLRFGRFGPNNNGFPTNFGPSFGSSNAGGFVPNGFGSNGGYANGIYNNNNRDFIY